MQICLVIVHLNVKTDIRLSINDIDGFVKKILTFATLEQIHDLATIERFLIIVLQPICKHIHINVLTIELHRPVAENVLLIKYGTEALVLQLMLVQPQNLHVNNDLFIINQLDLQLIHGNVGIFLILLFYENAPLQYVEQSQPF